MFRTLGTIAMMLTVTVAANAQWDTYPWKRMPRTADGKIDLNAPPQRTSYGKLDLSGFWVPENPTKHLLNLAADIGEVPLKPAARALYNQRIANEGKDHPGVSCLPSGIPEKDNIPDGLKVVQTEDLTLICMNPARSIARSSRMGGPSLRIRSRPGWDIRWATGTKTRSWWRRSDKTAKDMARHERPAGDRIPEGDRTFLAAEDRPHGRRCDDRRSGGLHQTMDGQAVLDSVAGYGPHRKHLRGKQPRSGTHGGKVARAPVQPAWTAFNPGLPASAIFPLRNSRISALITSACVVGMPCGKPG